MTISGNRNNTVHRRTVSIACIIALALPLAAAAKAEPAWVGIGRAKHSIAEGNVGAALKGLHDVIGMETNNADAHFLLGELYRGERKFDTAIVHYNAAVKYAATLSMPSRELEARFNILLCRTNDSVIRDRDVTNILAYAAKRREPLIDWRIHFFLGSYYEGLGNEVRAMYHFTNADAISWINADRIANYLHDAAMEKSSDREAYYRAAAAELPSQRMLMYRISLLCKRAKDYHAEKRYLMRASDYIFPEQTKGTAKIDAYIAARLKELSVLPKPRLP